MAEPSPVVSMPPRRRWGFRICIVVMLLLGGLIVAPEIWGRRAQQRLDALLAEYSSRGEPTTLAELRRMVVPDEENGAIDLRAAARMLDENDKELDAIDEIALPLNDAEMRTVARAVKRYQPAIDAVRRAATKGAFDWQVQWQSPVMDMPLTDLGEQRHLAWFLCAAALWSHQEGRAQDMLTYVQDMMLIGRALEEHGGLMAQLCASGIEMMGVDTLAATAPTLRIAGSATPSNLSREQVRQLIAMLLDDAGVKRASRRGLIAERVSTRDSFDCLLSGRALTRAGSQAQSGNGLRYVGRGLLLDDAQIVMRHLTAISEGLDEPNWPAYSQRVPEKPADAVRSPRLHMMASMMAGGHSLMAQRYYKTVAERRMAAIALAIRWWSLDHDGRLPASLDELVPAYLPAIPLDPFSANGSAILYKPDPDRPILYSVSINGIDEGGLVTHPNRDTWQQPDAVVHLKQQPRRQPDSE